MSPRIRTIKPEFYSDEVIGQLPRDARLTMLGLISFADDEGRFRAHPAAVRAAVFPYDDLTLAAVAGWLRELARSGRVRLYEVGGQQYGAIVNWGRHQRVQHPLPSRIPGPLDHAHETVGASLEGAHEHGPGGIEDAHETVGASLEGAHEHAGALGKPLMTEVEVDPEVEVDHWEGPPPFDDPEPEQEPRAKKARPETEPLALASTTPSKPSDVDLVWSAYRSHHPRAEIDPDRRKLIKKWLPTYGADRLIAAIRGCHMNPWNLGQDPKSGGKKYLSLELILSDAKHIEGFEEDAAPKSITPAAKPTSSLPKLAPSKPSTWVEEEQALRDIERARARGEAPNG